MRKSRFTEEQIIGILQEYAAGGNVSDLCRKHGISNTTLYKWKASYAGMTISKLRQMKGLEAENGQLKRLLADAMLDISGLKGLLAKKTPDGYRPPGCSAVADGRASVFKTTCVQAGRDVSVQLCLSGASRPPRAAERAPDHVGRQAQAVWLPHVACQAGARGLQGKRQGRRAGLPRRRVAVASAQAKEGSARRP